jgi:aryl-alcohol dehydrogenase-like predicted oxidoreductase
MNKTKGKATIKETALRAEKKEKELHFTELGKTGFKVSQAGFGCYRVTEKNKEHYNSLEKALKEGINLIDTSTNYMWGESEVIVGNVVRDLIEDGIIKRNEIVIVSKIGYVQGPAMEVSKKRMNEGNPFPDMVYYDDNCWHCIDPEFLHDQLNRSLDRLNMEQLDVLLLHNPEYFLSLAKKKGTDREEAEKEYYSRIEKAFIYLEEEVEKGRISWYGISSNTFPISHEEFEHTSLERILNIAEHISKDNHFAVIQFPANLYEGGAIYNKNQRNASLSLVDLAGEANLGTLVNRPLNAYRNNELIRLSDFAIKEKISDKNLEEELKEFTIIENNIKKDLKDFHEGFGDILTDRWNSFSGIEHWNMVRYNYFTPQLSQIIQGQEVKDKELNKYIKSFNNIMEKISDYYITKAREKSDKIHKQLNTFIPDYIKNATLSQKAIWMLFSMPRISSVLVGMRKEHYVDDVLQSLKFPVYKDGYELWDLWKKQD